MERDFKALKANIWKYYIYNFFVLFFLFEPVLYIYLQKGLQLNLTEIMITVSFFTILCAALSIPGGVIGDKLGYKKTLIIGAGGIFFGAVGYALSENFYHIMLAEIVWAVGFSCTLGARESFIYDTLKNLGREKDYNRINGVSTALFWVGLAVSSIAGSLLAKNSLALPIQLSFIPLLIPLLVVLTFKEPKRQKDHLPNVSHVRNSFSYLRSHKKLKFLLFYCVIIALVIDAAHKFAQPFMDGIGINIAFFGVIFSFGYFFSGIGSLISHKIDNYIGEKKLLYTAYIATALTLLCLGLTSSPFAVIGIIIIFVIDGVQYPTMVSYMNRQIESKNRATVNSITNLTKSIATTLVLPLFGYLGDSMGVSKVFIASSILILLSFIIIKLWYKRL